MTQVDRPLFTDEAGQRDAAWVQAALAGEAVAFERLVDLYQRPAVGSAYRLLGNRDDAQDIVQEAFLRAYRSLDRLKEPSRFGPWLMRIVCNLSLNARRSRGTRATVTLDEKQGTDDRSSEFGERTGGPLRPEQVASGKELQEAIDAALETLPEKQRLSLVLFTIEGWAQKDIADMLECSIENVKWNVFQARRRLRVQLGNLLPG
ncbi:MAG: sigma-70 family RNA polymerase sigma factor [Phycisphaerales bacterium]|nr:sigma-70 family RNA polymerase sigma factor [Phycisphaerales bacterium]